MGRRPAKRPAPATSGTVPDLIMVTHAPERRETGTPCTLPVRPRPMARVDRPVYSTTAKATGPPWSRLLELATTVAVLEEAEEVTIGAGHNRGARWQ
jgi:hypothetical protein